MPWSPLPSPSLTLAGLPFLIIESSAVRPYRRGFYCSDESIKYPAKDGETISDGVLSAVGTLIVILSVGFFYFRVWGLFWWRGAWTSVWMCLHVLSHLGCVHGMRSGSTSLLFFIFLSNWLIWQMLLSKVTHNWAEPMKHFQFEPFLWNELLKNNPEECSDWKVLSLNPGNWIANKGT